MKENQPHSTKSASARLLLLAITVAFLCTGFYLWKQHLEPIRKFRVIIPNYLYQSGQPEPDNLRRYIEKYKFRTILNLRTDTEKWEKRMARNLGVKLIHLPIDARDVERLDILYKIFSNESNYPMLVHCKEGKNRSSIAIALHRVKFQHWPLESAIDEMIEKGVDPERYNKSLNALRKFLLGNTPQSKVNMKETPKQKDKAIAEEKIGSEYSEQFP